MERVAFLGRGGHTLPTYRALLNRIAERYELTVYSEVPLEKEWLDLEHKYSLKAVNYRNLPRRIREILFLFLLIKDHLTQPFHLVHAHSTYPTGFVAVVLQKLFRCPAIVSLHAAEGSAFPDIDFGDLLHRRRAWVNRWVMNQARAVTALTDFQRSEVKKNLAIKRSIIVIPRGVDAGRFHMKKMNVSQGPLVILSVGYLNAIKDPETLLRAFHRIQEKLESILIVVGQDYTDGAIHELAVDLGISGSVKFEGYISHGRIDEYYRKADLLLHTSRYESQGMVIAEAMASGVLVAGTKVGLLSDLSGDCCLSVSPRDPDALAKTVVELFHDQAKMTLLRENAYQWTRDHNLEKCCQEILNLYKQQIRA